MALVAIVLIAMTINTLEAIPQYADCVCACNGTQLSGNVSG